MIISFGILINTFDVHGADYYLQESATDSNPCTQASPCKTMDAVPVKNNLNVSPFTLFVVDKTSLSSNLTVTQKSSLRIIRNSGYSSTDLSYVEVKSGGLFTVTGKVQFMYLNFTMTSVPNQEGGVIVMRYETDNTALDVQRCVFYKCKVQADKKGGAIYARSSISASLAISYTQFIECEATSGGALYVDLFNGLDVTLNELTFDKCNANSGHGGGTQINFNQDAQGTVIFTGTNIFNECKANNGAGMYISLQRLQSSYQLTGTFQINNCESAWYGGGLYISNYYGTTNLSPTITQNIISYCTAQLSSGGIYSEVSESGQLNIANTVFQDCTAYMNTSSNIGDGGALHCSLYSGQIRITNSQFTRCQLYQSGCGGAIYFNRQSATSNISLTSTSFTDCKTLFNSSNQTFGWGGAVFLLAKVSAGSLTSTNLQMTSLSFSGCESCVGIGNNIHINSSDTPNTGQQIKGSSLITVTGVNDLYTSPNYAYDYMGINNFTAPTNIGTTSLSDHNPLFEQFFTSVVPNPSYIDATNGKDIKYCGPLKAKCKKITFAIDRNTAPPTGSAPSKDTKFELILTTTPSSDSNLKISLPTTYHNYITIQSIGYVSGGTGYTKQKISSSSNTNSLFSITGVGRIEILGLLFDNLVSTATVPLISASTSTSSSYCVTIIDCEFTLSGSSNLAHSIISINGGKVYIKQTLFKNYKFSGTNTAFVIQSSASTISIAELLKVDFTDITQSGSGSGAAINATLNSGSSLKISDSSTFARCKASSGSGGAIYSALTNGQIELNQVTFTSCESKTGAAVYSAINGTGKLTVTNQCSFASCTSSELGGAIYSTVSGGSADLNRVTMNGCKGTNGGGIYTIISGAGKLTVTNQSVFTGCQGSAGYGGAIYAQIINDASSSVCVSITGTASTFSTCTVPNDPGFGGAIFLDFASGTETKYDLTGASYSTTASTLNNAQYGKNLFIKAANLRTAVPMNDAARIKLGAINPETDFKKLMGYDGANTLAFPLYYVYTAVKSDIYHVNNAAGSYIIGSGYDNIFCGHYGWPCLTIDYSIQQTGSAAEKKIGIINEYKLGSLIQIDQSGKEVKILNSLTSTGSTTTTQSILLIEQAGKFSVTNGTLSFDKITFSININAEEGYIITGSTQSTKIQIDNCIMKTTAALSTINTGLVEVEYGILSVTNLNIKDVIIQERCVIKVNEGSNVGIVSIIGSTFENITRTGDNQKGGVIEGYLGSDNGQLKVSGTFKDCKVSNTDGYGGAIYIQISDDLLNKFDLSGTSYSGCDAQYGKSLFIDAYNLRTAVPIHTDASLTKTKIGAGSDEYEKVNLDNLMGYDGTDTSLAIPLYYVYTDINLQIYHVENADSTPNGIDNQFCGHLLWPCLRMSHAIIRTGDSTLKKIGILNEYILNEQVEINHNDKEIEIQNSLSASGTVTDIKSILNIEDNGKFLLNTGTFSFNKIIFTINENATTGYIISGTATSTQISIDNCLMNMYGSIPDYSLLTGLVELIGGSLNINNLEINDISISDSPTILIGENAGSVSVDNTQFDNILRTTSDDSIYQVGGTIEATIGGSLGQLAITNSNFIKCISQQSFQAGAVSLIVKDQRAVSISSSSFTQCESDLGSGIYAQILSGGTLTIVGTNSFICCKARLDLGAAFYSTISGTNSKLKIEDEIQFEGYIKDQDGTKQIGVGQGQGAYIDLQDNGMIEINEIIVNECKGINGGGIQINCQCSQKQTIQRIQLIDCIGTENGGGIYAIISSGEIEMNSVTISECSGLNGSGIYTSIDQSGKFTIKESCSISNCQSTSTGSGGGIYAIINSGEIEMNQITMNYCSGLNGSGGGIYAIINSGEIEMNQITMNYCSGLNGGGIYTQIDQSGKFTIKEQSTFTNCNSSNGNGGGIYVEIDFTIQSQISVQSTTFDSCQALNLIDSNIHKGYGSGIFISCINWDNINNGFNLGQVEYINCEADQGDKGLFIVMNELRELCRLGNPRGQYVRCKDYTTELSDISLLIGYRGSPNQFESATSEDLKDKISELEYYIRDSGNQWHISTLIDGIDRLSCGLKPNPCKTINYAFLLNPILFEGQYNPNTDIATMILLEDDMIDTVININTATIVGNNIAIQSENGGEGKTLSIDKIYKIGSNSESNTLFNVKGDRSKLGLYHLKMDNSLVTSTSPLILLTGDSANNIDSQLHIESCIFAQSGNTPLPELKHNLIQINGGYASIKNTQISNYLFSNGKSAINVDSITDSQEYSLILSRTSFSKIIQKGDIGGSALKATIKSGSSIQLQDYCIFEECISESGLGGAIKTEQNGGILNIKETIMKKCKALNGGGIYSSILTMQEFLIAEEVYFEECDAFSSSQSQGRGGAIYLNVGQDAPYEFTVGVNLHFNLNKASQYGRDLFILCKNIIVMKPDRRILYDMLNETYDKDNAIFGTEFAQETELGRPQMIDFDILQLMLPYYNDIVYVSKDQSISENTLKCGRIYLPCVTLSYAEGKVLTPEWTYETVPLDSTGVQQINYTFIIFRGSEITLPFETEVNNVIIRGAFPDEYLFATQRAILIFTKSGQIICSDLAQWQQQGQLERRSMILRSKVL
ncbi:MAG: hypothetical protein EZS28_006523 [Streblomastix strix]|uniref:Uncharacterized protein n=1 Tax=Streblomastix strix TaxID=222440 RepID=A0A5J4WSQ0_9EUKA|nr:MAG: hypothetical protein EZS28_006523 [Streblomastix strix]